MRAFSFTAAELSRSCCFQRLHPEPVYAYLPMLFVQMPQPSAEAHLALTTIAVVLGMAGRGFGRWAGLVLAAGYAAYAVVALMLPRA